MDIAKMIQNNRAELDNMPRAYELNVSDVFELLQESGAPVTDAAFNSIVKIYQYGFIRGRNYAMNKRAK